MANGTEITISSEDKGTIIKGTAKTRTNGTDTVIDINDLSSITITLRDPDGDTTTATATAVNADGGTDGIWSFTTSTAIFSNNAGFWQIQAKYDFSSGKIFYSNIKTINIAEVVV
mgnify:FL=1|jgi:hypothetical protein|tara:strand:+ start:3497 stop:3841 length:345 start_codon:yes stop_codon:yes gene_type:complete